MKLCPFCKEEIQDEAKKCKHCGEYLIGNTPKANRESTWEVSSFFSDIKWGVMGKIAIWVVVFSIIAVVFYSEDSSEEALDLNNTWVEYFESWNFEMAASYFDKALVIDPTDELLLTNMCKSLWELWKYAQANGYCDRAIESNPNYIDALSKKCDILYDSWEYEEGLIYCDRALSIEDDDLRALSNKCNILYKQGEITSALDVCKKVLEIDPQSDVWLNNMATLVSEYDPEEALGYYNRSLAIKNDWLTLRNKALTLLDLDRHSEALNTLEKIEIDDPFYNKKGEVLCRVHIGLEDYGSALESSNSYLQYNTGTTDEIVNTYVCKATTLLLLERVEESRLAYDKAIELDPSNEDALALLEYY